MVSHTRPGGVQAVLRAGSVLGSTPQPDVVSVQVPTTSNVQ